MQKITDWLSTIDTSRLALGGIAMAVILFVTVNIVSNTVFKDARIDLTEDGLFTIAEGTDKVLAEIDEPIDLRFYYSDQLDVFGPTFKNHARRVDELLDAYERRSDGKLRITRYNPQPFSPEEDLAVADGLQGVPSTSTGELAYFGLAASNSTDDEGTIAFLAPERANFLEYDLTRLIHDLANPEKPVVGMIGDLPLWGTQQAQYRPWTVYEQMGEFFNIRPIMGDFKEIAEDVDILMLAQPENLDDAKRYAIDQFAMRGGRILAFVDPHAESMGRNPMQPPMGNAVEAMSPLLTAWGVEIDKDQVVGDPASAVRVQAQSNGRAVIVDYLPWMGLGASGMASDDVVTGDLSVINVTSAGAIKAAEGATTTIEPLVATSDQAAFLPLAEIQFAPDPAKLLGDFQPGDEPLTIAARVSGPIKSAFPDGPPEGVNLPEGNEHITEAEAPLNLILVADADLLADRNWVRQQGILGASFTVPVASNGDFAVNALDNLAGSEGLISLRGRGLTERPFEVIASLERQAEQQFRAKEQELLAAIEDTDAKIRALQQEEQETGVILTSAQQAEITDFRATMLDLRGELRDVQRSLRDEVEGLKSTITTINVWAIPGFVALFAIGLALFRRRKATTA